MTISAGRLRHRVTIQRRQDTQDPTTGEMLLSWADLYASVPAAIEPLSVKEFLASQAEQSQVTSRITIRYRAGLDSSMRILHGSKIYNPAGFLADPDSGLEYMTIPCSEGTNDG